MLVCRACSDLLPDLVFVSHCVLLSSLINSDFEVCCLIVKVFALFFFFLLLVAMRTADRRCVGGCCFEVVITQNTRCTEQGNGDSQRWLTEARPPALVG